MHESRFLEAPLVRETVGKLDKSRCILDNELVKTSCPKKMSYHIWIDDLIYSSPWKSFHKLVESPMNYDCHNKSN